MTITTIHFGLDVLISALVFFRLKMQNKELQFDPQNLPKYCPQCKLNGKKSKVKAFTLKDEKVVMCKNAEVCILHEILIFL